MNTVLITGGAKRVGRHIALAMADSGWDIAIHYNKSHDEAHELADIIRKKDRKCFVVQADLANPNEVANIFSSLIDQGANINCLINNASIFEKDNIKTINPESWNNHLNINLFAPLQLIRDFSNSYKGTEGNIINITDGVKGWSISPNFLSYSISKTGLENSVKLLSHELAPNIRINSIAAGASLEGKQDKEDTFEKLKNYVPLKRTSSPQEIYETIQYLISAKSVTGQVISLAGGL